MVISKTALVASQSLFTALGIAALLLRLGRPQLGDRLARRADRDLRRLHRGPGLGPAAQPGDRALADAPARCAPPGVRRAARVGRCRVRRPPARVLSRRAARRSCSPPACHFAGWLIGVAEVVVIVTLIGRHGLLARRLHHRDALAADPRDRARRPGQHRHPGAGRRLAVHVPRHARGRRRHALAAQARARDLLRQHRPRLPGATHGRSPGIAERLSRDLSSGDGAPRARPQRARGLAARPRPRRHRPARLHHARPRARPAGAARSPDALYARAAEVLDAARAAGVRYVDAARSYGRRRGVPRALARSSAAVARAELTVGSKWGYRYTAGWSVEAPGARGEGAVAGPLPQPARREPRAARRLARSLPDPQRDGGIGRLADAVAARARWSRRGAPARSAPSGSR